jgi:cytochrome P450/NADPH-cytochrome P450 reductase
VSSYTAEISQKRVSILDLLERFPSVALPFGSFLGLLPPMRLRQYSISSSPLWNPGHVTLTYSPLDTPSLADPTRHHVGVATSYLASLVPGDRLHVSVRPSHSAFHLPLEPDKSPLICVAAGTGMAPFRAFVQERAAQIAAGRTVAPALLFFGCHGPNSDDIYRSEMDAWQAFGAVDVRRAYSRVDLDSPEARDAAGCKHVDDRLWTDRDDVIDLWKRGARMYVCGSRDVGESVKRVVLKMATQAREKDGHDASPEATEKWFANMRNERYATDVFD